MLLPDVDYRRGAGMPLPGREETVTPRLGILKLGLQ